MITIRATAARCGVLAAATAALLLAGCAGQTPEQQRLTGQIAGGVAGAAVGSAFGSGSGKVVAVGAGAVLGAIAGGELATR
jgi:outer membrane lipoprotein SlyB